MGNVYTPITGNSAYKLVFDDEFNGTSLNLNNWQSPPNNQRDNTYTTGTAEYHAANISVANGSLDMAVTPDTSGNGYKYWTSGLTSKGSTIAGEPVNIYVEARIKNMDNSYGLASDFWTDQSPNWTFPESDVSEYWQGYTADATGNHYNDGSTWVLPNEGSNPGLGDLAQGYHVYGMLWTPTGITYYVDGIETAHTTTDTSKTTPEWYAILNATVGGGGQSPNSSTQIPNNMLVDYVHVYSAQPGAVAITPEAGYGGPGDNGTGGTSPPPPPPPEAPPSPNDTFITAGFGLTLTDNNSNAWTIDNNDQVEMNGMLAGISSNVTELAFVGGSVWQENSNNLWWEWNGTSWGNGSGTAQSPLPFTQFISGATPATNEVLNAATTTAAPPSIPLEYDIGAAMKGTVDISDFRMGVDNLGLANGVGVTHEATMGNGSIRLDLSNGGHVLMAMTHS